MIDEREWKRRLLLKRIAEWAAIMFLIWWAAYIVVPVVWRLLT